MIMAAVAGVVLVVAIVLIVRAVSSGSGSEPTLGDRIRAIDETPEPESVPQP